MEMRHVKKRAHKRILMASVLKEISEAGGPPTVLLRCEMELLLEGSYRDGDPCDMAWTELETTIKNRRYAWFERPFFILLAKNAKI